MSENNNRVKNTNDSELQDRLVAINRVTKVTKGGRRLRFAATVAVGDGKGKVGLGTGKANEVQDAIKKAVQDATNRIIKIDDNGSIFDRSMTYDEFLEKFGE